MWYLLVCAVTTENINPISFPPEVIMTNCCIYGIEIHQHISLNLSAARRSSAAFPHSPRQSRHSVFLYSTQPSSLPSPCAISPPVFLPPSLRLHTAALPELKSIRYGVWPLASQLLSIKVIVKQAEMKTACVIV